MFWHVLFQNLPACSAGSGFRSSDTGIMERLKSFTHCCRTVKLFPRFQTDCRQPPSQEKHAAVDSDVVIFFINMPGLSFPESSPASCCMSCYQICIRISIPSDINSGLAHTRSCRECYLDHSFPVCASPSPPCTLDSVFLHCKLLMAQT